MPQRKGNLLSLLPAVTAIWTNYVEVKEKWHQPECGCCLWLFWNKAIALKRFTRLVWRAEAQANLCTKYLMLWVPCIMFMLKSTWKVHRTMCWQTTLQCFAVGELATSSLRFQFANWLLTKSTWCGGGYAVVVIVVVVVVVVVKER